MNLEFAKPIVLAILRKTGGAKNSVLLEAQGNDRAVLDLVREDLIPASQ